MQITLSTLFTHKTTAPRILWCFPFFFSFLKNKHNPMFSQGFLGNQSFNTKTKIKLVLVPTNKFRKFKWYPNTYKKPERQPEHHEITLKLIFDCMNNEKPFCIFACEKAKLVDSNCMHLKWRKAIFDHPFINSKKIPWSPFLSLMHFSWKITLARITPYTGG